MKVVITGSGNVATVLGKIIQKAGHQVVQVMGRDEQKGKLLAGLLDCPYGSYPSSSYKDADIYLFAITDNALHHIEPNTSLAGKLVLHTAGSVSKDVLIDISGSYGVMYPLQSLSKSAIILPAVPLLVDGNTGGVLERVKSFAQTLSGEVFVARDDERLKFHIAGVFVNNFTNHLYALADDFCDRENIDFSRLLPLIEETTNKIKLHPPKQMQTGPALRQDLHTLGKHLKLLSANPDLKYIYLKMSESILKLHQVK